MKKFVRVFLVFLSLIISLSAHAMRDSAGVEVNVGDRVLIHGAHGYVRVLNTATTETDGSYRWSAEHSWFGKYDVVGESGFLESQSRSIKFFKSLSKAKGPIQVGDTVSFYEAIPGYESLELTKTIQTGKVTEVFSGGHYMVRTGWITWVAISARQLVSQAEAANDVESDSVQLLPLIAEPVSTEVKPVAVLPVIVENFETADLSTPEGIVQNFKNKKFVEEKYGFNDSIVSFEMNPATGRPNLVYLNKDRGKINYYEYLYDIETWWDFTVSRTEKGYLIQVEAKDLNFFYRWSYPWEKDLFAHPEWETKRYQLQTKILETTPVDGKYGTPQLKGEGKVVAQEPYATSYLLSADGKTLIQSPQAPYPGWYHLKNR